MVKKLGELTLSLGASIDKGIEKAARLGDKIKKININAVNFDAFNNTAFEFSGAESSLKQAFENAAVFHEPEKISKKKKIKTRKKDKENKQHRTFFQQNRISC